MKMTENAPVYCNSEWRFKKGHMADNDSERYPRYGSLGVPEAHKYLVTRVEGALSYGPATTPHQTYSSTNPPIHLRPIQTHSIPPQPHYSLIPGHYAFFHNHITSL